MESRTKSQIKCYNDYFSKKDDGTWGPLLNSTLPHWTLMGTNDGPRWVNKGSTTSTRCKGQSDIFFKPTEMWWKTAQRHEPLMTSLRPWRWNELNDDDDPAVALGEGRKHVRRTLHMLDTVCGTPCCMLKCSQSGSGRNTALQSDGHMLTSTWCSSYYTRKCWKMCR